MKLIKKLGAHRNKTNKLRSYGLFLCTYCNKEVEKRLDQGRIDKSCGCMQIQLRGNKRHGDAKKSRLYNIWCNIKSRCCNKNSICYKYYGGRGIKVCNQWRNLYIEFKKWALANGYKDDLTIDRIDNNGNYEPDNCRWTNKTIQARNSRGAVLIAYKGETHCIAKWAEILNVNNYILYGRLHRGWSINRAFTEPPQKGRRKNVHN